MRYNKNSSLTLDTAIRLLDKCGYELSIVPKEDKKKKPISYDHPDIIPPIGYYEKRSEWYCINADKQATFGSVKDRFTECW